MTVKIFDPSIVRFGASAGKIDLRRISIDHPGNLPACLFDCLMCPHTLRMNAAWIAYMIRLKPLKHLFKHFGVYGSGCCVIKVNHSIHSP